MNPHLLTLALTTPLEQLLELPNAVRIAACAREDLQRFSAEQLQRMLASMDAAITDTVTLAQIKHGGELVSRHEQRDLDWFIEVTNQAEWPRLRSANATERDYPPLKMVQMTGDVYTAGIEEHLRDGVTLRVYSVVKTVADCFKHRNKIGLDVALEVLKDVRAKRKASADDLWRYAKICRVANVMRPYLEAIE